jgi:hypothetical protein
MLNSKHIIEKNKISPGVIPEIVSDIPINFKIIPITKVTNATQIKISSPKQ